jgi:hypothetical protein
VAGVSLKQRKKRRFIATLTKWSDQDKSYHFLRRVTLRNPERPLTAVIADDARFLVTFDDWCRMGETENAVVIYDLGQGYTSISVLIRCRADL